MGDIFLKLLNMSITASWLILTVLCIRLLFRKIPKWITCLLWGVVAIRLIFPFSIESSFSLQPSAELIRTSTIVEGEIVPYVPSVDSNLNIIEDTVNPLLAEAFEYQETESVAPLQVFTGITGSVWLCGMVVLLIFALVSMIKLRLCVREAVRYRENIYICDAVKSSFILGIIKPSIYLSSALNKEEMDYIIAHEIAHLRRKDHLWKPFGYLLLCIYWFNPLCWIAYIMLCKDIELACDEKVIKDMSFGDKKEYSRVLLSCASQKRLVSVCPLAFGKVGVKERVKSVLNYKKPAVWITILAIIICIIVAICFLTNPEKEYRIKITIPADSTEEMVYQEDFFYSDEEISPTANKITISLDEGMGDTEVVLKPIEVKEENAYEPTYITPGMPVKMDVEKDAWFKIGVNMQNSTTEDIDVYVSVRNVEVRIASNGNTESENNVYGNVIAGLGDNEAYAFLDMNYDNMVLLTSDMIYDERTEKQAAVYCDVYYPVDGEAKKIGTIMSSGTAYPVTFTKDGIFVASGHTVEKYVILEDGELYLEKGACEQFDETGNVTYISITGKQENESTVQEYQMMVEEYGRSQIVHFSYGAESSVNEYFEKEMEMIPQEEMIEELPVREDFYEVATSMPADEVEEFAMSIKADVLNHDWETLSEKIVYPISIDGFVLNGSSDFMELDFDRKLSQEFVDAIRLEGCREMFCNGQGIMMGNTGQIWLSGVDEGTGTWELKIIGINGMLDLSEEIATPVAGITMVDISKVSGIVVTNLPVHSASAYRKNLQCYNKYRSKNENRDGRIKYLPSLF